MGCWNGTDFLGGMPLRSGDDIRAVIILNRVQPIEASGFCYGGSGYATPISFMIKGTYNDYGGIEFDEDQVAVIALKEVLKQNYERIKISYDSYDKDVWTIDEFDTPDGMNRFINDYIERDRVTYKGDLYGSISEYVPMGFVMMSEIVLESVIGSFKHPSYIDNNIYQDSVYFVEDVILKKDDIDDESSKIFRGFSSGWDDSNARRTGKWTGSCNILSNLSFVNAEHFRAMLRIFKDNTSMHTKKDELSQTISDFIHLLQSMESLRISWRSDAGKGSQHFGISLKVSLIEGILKQINEYYDGDVEYVLSKNIINPDSEIYED